MSRAILNWDVRTDEIGCVSPAYNIYKIDKNIINPLYVKYYIQANINDFKDLIRPASREGQGIDKALLMEKEVLVPPTSVYNSIVSKLEMNLEKERELLRELEHIKQNNEKLIPEIMFCESKE